MRVLILSLLLAGLSAHPAAAATLSVHGPTDVAVGETIELSLDLELAPGEDASLFFGEFLVPDGNLVGSVALDPLGFGSTWDLDAIGNVDPSGRIFRISLIALENRADHDHLATLQVTGLASGVLSIQILAQTTLQRDLDVAPFIEDVPFQPGAGSVLASIQVGAVPEPALFVLLGSVLLGLAVRRG